MSRARKTTGRIAFVGSGPGDPGMLTVRAHEQLSTATLLVTDPDVPAEVLALAAEGAEVRPAVGEPADVARDLVAEVAFEDPERPQVVHRVLPLHCPHRLAKEA